MTTKTASKVWFITGCSRGLGRIWAEAALERGDRVVATARQRADVAGLSAKFGDRVLPMALDVTDGEQVRQVVQQAHAHFGRLDVVINNAGYPLIATTEEAQLEDVRAVFDTNYLGTLRVIQATLPILRQQGSGHLVGVSSTVGIVSMPLIGVYCATKFAVEALHESLAQEVAGFGIRVTLIEPGAYATDFGGPGSSRMSKGLEAYAPLREQVMGRLSTMERGNPGATASAVLKLVDTERPPLRFILGASGLPWVSATYQERLATWESWQELSRTA